MQLEKAIETYLAELRQGGYGENNIRQKATMLYRHLSYALALCHPSIPRTILELSEIRMYCRGIIKTETTPRRMEAAQNFIAVF